MTDALVAELLRSDEKIVLIEAPAGCGKTYQAAEYCRDAVTVLGYKRVLVLTHTHAACSVVAENTKDISKHVSIRTLDGLIFEIAKAYRVTLGLPEDLSSHILGTNFGWGELAEQVATLLSLNPMIATVLARKYPVIICDEHQDSSTWQEQVVMSIAASGSLLRIFGDPMQIIPAGRGQDEVVTEVLSRWNGLKSKCTYAELNEPHRWLQTNPGLGSWILDAREKLMNGNQIELPEIMPDGMKIICANKVANSGGNYRIAPVNGWADINSTINGSVKMLCVAGRTNTVWGLRSSFSNRLSIWEGHSRTNLEKFVTTLNNPSFSLVEKARAFVDFLKSLVVGFTSQVSNRLVSEVESLSVNPRGAIPPEMRVMAAMIRESPDHRGFANAAVHLKVLMQTGPDAFRRMKIVLPREFQDLVRLCDFEDCSIGLAEISSRWSRLYPTPPDKCLSTVHKSKGLQAHTVVVFGCDGEHFSDRPAKRNLLYVALSRATDRLVIVTSPNDPCPLIKI